MEEEFYLALLERTPEQLLETVICLRGAVASGWVRQYLYLCTSKSSTFAPVKQRTFKDCPLPARRGSVGLGASA